MAQATVVGSGPNGLAAALTLARAGVSVRVLERNARLGGACTTAEITLPGFHHDLGSSVYPMGVASPFFRKAAPEIPWIEPPAPCAHPLDDGSAVMLERSIEATVEQLDPLDRAAYRGLMEPLAERFADLVEDVLGPVLHVPRHPWLLARFGLPGLLPAAALARMRFQGPRARALFAGMAAHSVQPLEAPATAAVALVLMAAGHASGWPIVRGGAGRLAETLASRLATLGGSIELNHEVAHLPASDGRNTVTLADVTPRQLLRLASSAASSALPQSFRASLENFRYGGGAFKVDYALSQPIPWTAHECLRAATVHVGGSLDQIADSERVFGSERPFVLLVQPSLFDPSRAPAGKHTAWAYCHVPQGSAADHLPALERQIERFAPGFRDCVLARAVSPPAALEAWNPNLVGGGVSGGAMDLRQMAFRPTLREYGTPLPGLFLCGASTPPGGGVHGMAGHRAAQMALRQMRR